MMDLKIKLLSMNAYTPTKGTEESAGFDFYTPVDVIIPSRSDVLIPLDISMEMPIGFAMIMKEKSGLATKKKIVMGASVIDNDYRGNCHAHLFNLSDETVYFKKGEKVCQGVMLSVPYIEVVEVEELNNTVRGEGGFGSTGR